MTTPIILIYNDLGSSQDCVNALLEYFRSRATVMAKATIKCVSGADLQSGNWISETSILIMPGGRSLPFYKTLGDRGNQKIKTFVEQGGCYFGLCAGAYYAAEKTIFAKDLPLELQLDGALNFFAGRAIGPVFAESDFEYGSENGARRVDVKLENGEVFSTYFNGGCYFENADEFKNTKIIARYAENNLPAIIACQVKSGCAILSGVHPELSFPDIKNNFQLLSILFDLALQK